MRCPLCGAIPLAFMRHCAVCAAMLADLDRARDEKLRRAADEAKHYEAVDEHNDDGAAWEPDEPYFGPEEAW